MTDTVGIQANSLGGSFHEIAANQYFGERDTRLVPSPTHRVLMQQLNEGSIDRGVIAVDNNTSGRVNSAIDAIKQNPNLWIEGSITTPIEQHLLYYPGMTIDDIVAVMSQRPALDQCQENIMTAGLKTIERHDTVFSARYVSKTGGVIHDAPFAAIASELAGIECGLDVGELFNDNRNNATKFWVVTKDSHNKDGSHAALTFEVPDRAGALYEAIGILSVNWGLNLTDIDSHLSAHKSDVRTFFAEVELEESGQIEEATNELDEAGFQPQLMGNYSPINNLSVTDNDHHVPSALRHDTWNGRHGLLFPESATVIYVETNHEKASLHKILGSLAGCNLIDLGRPTVPKDHNFNRGFYIVIDPETPLKIEKDAISKIAEEHSVEVVNNHLAGAIR